MIGSDHGHESELLSLNGHQESGLDSDWVVKFCDLVGDNWLVDKGNNCSSQIVILGAEI